MLGWQQCWAFFGCIDAVAYHLGTDATDSSTLKVSYEESSQMKQNKGTKCKQADTQEANESHKIIIDLLDMHMHLLAL